MYCRRRYLKYLASIKSVIVSVRRCPVAAMTGAPSSQTPIKLDILKWCGTTHRAVREARARIAAHSSGARELRRPGELKDSEPERGSARRRATGMAGAQQPETQQSGGVQVHGLRGLVRSATQAPWLREVHF